MKTKANIIAPIVALTDGTIEEIRDAINEFNDALQTVNDAATTLYGLIDDASEPSDEGLNAKSSAQRDAFDELIERFTALRDELQDIDVPNEIDESVLDYFTEAQDEMNETITRANKRAARKTTKRSTR